MNTVSFTFFGKKKVGNELSNFYKGEVIIIDKHGNGHKFSCGEAAFHGMKYYLNSKECSCPKRKKILEEYSKKFELGGTFYELFPREIKKKGGKRGLKLLPSEIKVWSKYRENIQAQICIYKFNTDETVKKCLMATEKKILIHPAMRVGDSKMYRCFWEGRMKIKKNGEGQKKIIILGENKLGNIWMIIRKINNKN